MIPKSASPLVGLVFIALGIPRVAEGKYLKLFYDEQEQRGLLETIGILFTTSAIDSTSARSAQSPSSSRSNAWKLFFIKTHLESKMACSGFMGAPDIS